MPQLMEVLEFLDDSGSVMVARVPEAGECEIKWGAQLTVRESQEAVFFRDGQSMMVFEPGRHVLQTQNIPVLTKLVTWFGYGPTSPFRSEVYFVSTKLFRNLKWGTKEPIIFRDPELQMIRLRSFGTYSIRVVDSSLFVNRMVGTQGVFLDSDIQDYLRSIILTRLINLFADNIKSIFDLPKYYNSLGAAAKAACALDFQTCGLELVDFFVNAISPPEEVQRIIDEKTSMHVLDNLGAYMQFKAAKSIEEAAKNTSGAAGAGMGLGAGVGLGMMLPGMIQDAIQHREGNTSTPADPAVNDDPYAKLEKLKKLLDLGAISQDEYAAKKTALLAQL